MRCIFFLFSYRSQFLEPIDVLQSLASFFVVCLEVRQIVAFRLSTFPFACYAIFLVTCLYNNQALTTAAPNRSSKPNLRYHFIPFRKVDT